MPKIRRTCVVKRLHREALDRESIHMTRNLTKHNTCDYRATRGMKQSFKMCSIFIFIFVFILSSEIMYMVVTISSFFNLKRRYRYLHGHLFNGYHFEPTHTENDPWEAVDVARTKRHTGFINSLFSIQSQKFVLVTISSIYIQWILYII
ncbi:MAG: hypothetical protein ACI8RD_005662 [Bacillariaceae sp.]|jgi:hypothetical protein